jgi:hypothetical protein
VLLLGVTGCSDGGDGAGGSGQSSLPADRAGGTAPSTGGSPGGTDTTTAPAADYCGLARRYFKAFERFGQPGTSPELRAYYRDATVAIDQALPVAPAEIQPDLAVVSDGLKALVAGLDGIGYDFSRAASLPPDLIIRLMSQQFVQSSTKVATYSRDKCGLS